MGPRASISTVKPRQGATDHSAIDKANVFRPSRDFSEQRTRQPRDKSRGYSRPPKGLKSSTPKSFESPNGLRFRSPGRGGVTKTHVLWRVNKGSNVPSPI